MTACKNAYLFRTFYIFHCLAELNIILIYIPCPVRTAATWFACNFPVVLKQQMYNATFAILVLSILHGTRRTIYPHLHSRENRVRRANNIPRPPPHTPSPRELIRIEFLFTSLVVFGIILRRWDRQGALRMAQCDAGSVCRPDKEAVAT